MRILLDGSPSWRQRRRSQAVNEAQDLSEQGDWDGDLGQSEGDVAAMADNLGADLDQLLAQRGNRPTLCILGPY
jgi:hypothetical protein